MLGALPSRFSHSSAGLRSRLRRVRGRSELERSDKKKNRRDHLEEADTSCGNTSVVWKGGDQRVELEEKKTERRTKARKRQEREKGRQKCRRNPHSQEEVDRQTDRHNVNQPEGDKEK